ncbi:36568_t:CDS:1, partial [Gigaspora margarita]
KINIIADLEMNYWSLDKKVWHFDLKYKEATDTGEEEQAVYFKNKRDKIIHQIYHLRKHCEEIGYRLFFDE